MSGTLDHQTFFSLSCRDNECLCQISWQSIRQLSTSGWHERKSCMATDKIFHVDAPPTNLSGLQTTFSHKSPHERDTVWFIHLKWIFARNLQFVGWFAVKEQKKMTSHDCLCCFAGVNPPQMTAHIFFSPESALLRTESMEQQPQSDSDLASLSSSSAASPGQPYHIPHSAELSICKVPSKVIQQM